MTTVLVFVLVVQFDLYVVERVDFHFRTHTISLKLPVREVEPRFGELVYLA